MRPGKGGEDWRHDQAFKGIIVPLMKMGRKKKQVEVPRVFRGVTNAQCEPVTNAMVEMDREIGLKKPGNEEKGGMKWGHVLTRENKGRGHMECFRREKRNAGAGVTIDRKSKEEVNLSSSEGEERKNVGLCPA